jgi:hypothetical protein
MRKPLILLGVVCLSACADPDRERLKATTKPTYDPKTGKLTELTYDANKNGRIETWTEMDGTRALRSLIDRDEDGKIDRWEHYDDKGELAKVGFSRKNDGQPDAWAFAGPDGKLWRIEISSAGDENRIDRREYYDASAPLSSDGTGALVRAEEDTNSDGRIDKWETYEVGVVKAASFDENADGIPDRRLTYTAGALHTIETAPDSSGRFTKRIEISRNLP